jgi:hypothetical protein
MIRPWSVRNHRSAGKCANVLDAWEWSERFVRARFRLATAASEVLARARKIEVESNAGDPPWLTCFYSKPDAPPLPARIERRSAEAAGLAVPAASSDVGAEFSWASGAHTRTDEGAAGAGGMDTKTGDVPAADAHRS